MKSLPLLLFISLTTQVVFTSTAQKDSAHGLKFSCYVDAYYARYSDSAGPGKFQKFGYESPVSNSFGINQAQLTVDDTLSSVRATITFQYGDVPRALWSPIYNYIQEANAGVKLSRQFWIDAGFFRTHIGTESMLARDNFCSAQSVISWSEPFYQSGVRLTYTPSQEFTGALLLVNGSNQFIPANKKKALGLALTATPSSNVSIGYYNLLSDDTPDSISMAHWRLWNNFVFSWTISEKLKAQVGADFVTQQNSNIALLSNGTSYATAMAFGTIISLRYQFSADGKKLSSKFSIHARLESFYDPQGIISNPDNYYFNNPSLHLIGETFGLEFKPTDNSFMRIEGRELEAHQDEKIFYSDGKYSNNRGEVMLNIGVWF